MNILHIDCSPRATSQSRQLSAAIVDRLMAHVPGAGVQRREEWDLLDLFFVWWVVVLALGVAGLYQRPAGPLARAFACVSVGLAGLMAVAMAILGAS